MKPDIEKALQFMITIANDDSHGYDQTNRNGPDYDCSSLVGTALHKAGFDVSPYSWTGNLRKQLLACGFIQCKEPFIAGDIHLAEGHHVAMSISTNEIVHASINEYGKISGGKTGDQTGREICIRSYYDYPWDYHFRYTVLEQKPISEVAKEVLAGKYGVGFKRYERLKADGYSPEAVQAYVNWLLLPESHYDVMKVAREVLAGKWGNGEERKEKLSNAGYNYLAVQGFVNDMLTLGY